MSDGPLYVDVARWPAPIRGRRRAPLACMAPCYAHRYCRAPAIAVTILLLGACARPSVRAMRTPGLASGPPLGVLRAGWHTGLVIPKNRLSGALRPLRTGLADDAFAVIGWGQRRYYMARHPGPLTGLAALFRSRSVVYARGWRPRPTDAQHVIWLRVGPRGWQGLQAFLARTLARAPQGGLEALGAHGHRGLFFAATSTYDAFHTCNTWTMQALRAAHLPATSTGILFAGQVSAALHARPLRRFRDPASGASIPSASGARDTTPRIPRSSHGSFLDKRGSVAY